MTTTFSFSKNWNNKLYCPVFTTIRIMSNKYAVGKEIILLLNNAHWNSGRVVRIETKQASQLEENECLLDTGMSKAQTLSLLGTMYGTPMPQHLDIVVVTIQQNAEALKKKLQPFSQTELFTVALQTEYNSPKP